MEATTNLIGGQPFSLENLREVKEIASAHNIPLVFDGSLISENAYFIKQREPAYAGHVHRRDHPRDDELGGHHVPLRPQEHRVRGGLIATNNRTYYDRFLPWLPVYEGFSPTAACPPRRSRRWPSASAR